MSNKSEASKKGNDEADWAGKHIDWGSEIVEVKLYAELPFWIASPPGKVVVKIDECQLTLQFQNDVVGLYRNGTYAKSEFSLLQLTTEGAPFSEEQSREIDSEASVSKRHYRTLVSIPVLCHSSVFDKLQSPNKRIKLDAKIYVQSLAYRTLEFVNKFIYAYRSASLDPFVSQVSYWDVPLWHLKDWANNLWQIPMAAYQVSDELPLLWGEFRCRTSVAEIQNCVNRVMTPSLDELLDAWTCYYRGQFAEAVRKVVTSIEMTFAELIAELPELKGKNSKAETADQIRKMRFRDQVDYYCRNSGRRLPGPLTHISPEVSGVRLIEELFDARELRHKIVHESCKIDMYDQGPMRRIMETMSWLHGWLRGDPRRFDPTSSASYHANENLKNLHLFQTEIDRTGIRVIPPNDEAFDDPRTFNSALIEEVHVRKLMGALNREKSDLEYCVAWFLHIQRVSYRNCFVDECWEGTNSERFSCRFGTIRRLVFIVDTPTLLSQSEFNEIICRCSIKQCSQSQYFGPLVVVNHFNCLRYNERPNESCVQSLNTFSRLLGVTILSVNDLVTMAVISTRYPERSFGFLEHQFTPGPVNGLPSCFQNVGRVRRVYERINVVSVVLEEHCIRVGDELLFRAGCDARIAVIKSIEIRGVQLTTAYSMETVGIKLGDDSLIAFPTGTIVYKVLRPRLELSAKSLRTYAMQIPRNRNNFSREVVGNFTAYGIYDSDD